MPPKEQQEAFLREALVMMIFIDCMHKMGASTHHIYMRML